MCCWWREKGHITVRFGLIRFDAMIVLLWSLWIGLRARCLCSRNHQKRSWHGVAYSTKVLLTHSSGAVAISNSIVVASDPRCSFCTSKTFSPHTQTTKT